MKTAWNHLILAGVPALVLCLASVASAQVSTGAYLGLKPPGKVAEAFAPGLFDGVLSPGTSGFLREGRVFVFSAMKPGSDWRFKPTYWMELKEGSWTEPEIAPWSDYLPYNFTVGPAGQTVYFTSLKSPDTTTRMLLEQANIWAVTLRNDGWTEPVMLGASINTESFYENYPTVSASGTVYYMSRREDGVGRTDIYRSRNLDGRYGEAENLGPPINSPESDQDPFIAPDESYLIVCLTGRPDSFGSYDLYVSFMNEDESWSDPVNMGEGVNSEGAEFRPYVTQDGKYLLFTSNGRSNDEMGGIYWVSAHIIEDLRASQRPANPHST